MDIEAEYCSQNVNNTAKLLLLSVQIKWCVENLKKMFNIPLQKIINHLTTVK